MKKSLDLATKEINKRPLVSS
jgi:hypothetical protein